MDESGALSLKTQLIEIRDKVEYILKSFEGDSSAGSGDQKLLTKADLADFLPTTQVKDEPAANVAPSPSKPVAPTVSASAPVSGPSKPAPEPARHPPVSGSAPPAVVSTPTTYQNQPSVPPGYFAPQTQRAQEPAQGPRVNYAPTQSRNPSGQPGYPELARPSYAPTYPPSYAPTHPPNQAQGAPQGSAPAPTYAPTYAPNYPGQPPQTRPPQQQSMPHYYQQ